VRAVQRRLRKWLGPFEPKPRLPIVDELVWTVLSQATSDVNSGRAFQDLKKRFPSWEQVLEAPVERVADAIRSGGIANVKAQRIQTILAEIHEREGRLDLSRLDDLDDQAAADYLGSLPGVGPKTVACVLTFAMGRAAFPVDTHVHRIAKRLGWVGDKTSAEVAHELLTPKVPPELRYDLHVALIAHGRETCTAQRPRCSECVILDLCPSGPRFLADGLAR
jgi:endonuclease III